MSQRGTEIHFTPIYLTGTIGCCVPVLPGTSDWDAPIEERTELCAIDANWVVGMVPTCDLHVRQMCEMLDIGWSGLVDEAGRDIVHAERPREARERHSQEDARKHQAHFSREHDE